MNLCQMNVFSINEAARVEIQRILCRNKCSDPVAVLVDMANTDKFMRNVRKALLEGTDQEDLITTAKKRLEEVENQLVYCLKVVIYEQKDCNPENMININGIIFSMDSFMREALRDYCLAFEDCRFMLRSANDAASNLRSVKTIQWSE